MKLLITNNERRFWGLKKPRRIRKLTVKIGIAHCINELKIYKMEFVSC